jgi:hypothetical protein
MDFVNPYHNPPPLDIMLSGFHRDVNIRFGNSYVGLLRKHGIRNSGGFIKNKNPYYVKIKQNKLFYTGRSHHVDIKDFKTPKYTRQKKFRTGIFNYKKTKNKEKNRGKYAFCDKVENLSFFQN